MYTRNAHPIPSKSPILRELLNVESGNTNGGFFCLFWKIKVEALWFKCFIVFLENLVLGTFICADNDSKIKKNRSTSSFLRYRSCKKYYFLSKSHDLPHKNIREVRQINIDVLQKATIASYIFLIFTYVKVYLKYYNIMK